MRTLTCSKMTAAIERILCSHDLLEDFTKGDDFAVRIKNGSFMPLTIERRGSQVTVTHYYSQNGDLIADPDMEFEVITEHVWRPIAIQFADGTYRRATEVKDGKRLVFPRELRSQIQFSGMWAKNLVAQGFQTGVVERIN